MVGRIAITAAVWLIGAIFLFFLDGQHFTHGLQVLGCAVLGALPWIPLVSRHQSKRRRFAAIVVLGLSVVVIVRVSLHLPAAYEVQRRFNERTTPNDALQSDDHLPRFAQSVARR